MEQQAQGRVIKFRAWGTRVPFKEGAEAVSTEMAYFGLTDLDGTYIVPTGTYFEGDFKLMQFTGLHDKNGKEIYEGDVLRGTTNDWDEHTKKGDTVVVEHDEVTGGFAPFAIYDGDCGTQTSPKKVEVIGNIYENPELLR